MLNRLFQDFCGLFGRDIWKIPVIGVTKITRYVNVLLNRCSVKELNKSNLTCGSIRLQQDLWTDHETVCNAHVSGRVMICKTCNTHVFMYTWLID